MHGPKGTYLVIVYSLQESDGNEQLKDDVYEAMIE